jgi:N,N'-diacetyllegionaminate synthase
LAFIIAEVGSNYRDLDDCKLSVKLAAHAGADAVKFQHFSEHDLYGDGSKHPNISLDWLKELKSVADDNGIEFMCTAFSLQGLANIDGLVKRHKIASSEMSYYALIDLAVTTDKPVLISTGGHSLADIKCMYNSIKNAGVALMYCCNAYPSRQHNLFLINELRDHFSCPIGYSDHSIDLFTPFMAATMFRAAYLEKHVTINKSLITPDANHSIDFAEFTDLVRYIKSGEHLGSFVTPEQSAAQRFHNRRHTNGGVYRLRSSKPS